MPRASRLAGLLACLLMVVVSLPGPAATPAATAATLPPFPFPIADGPRPTIALSRLGGAPGDPVTVSGQGVAGYPGVRVAWAVDGITLAVAETPLDAAGRYRATVTVPTNLPDGPVQLCAAVSGAQAASFVCAGFALEAAAPGVVTGQLPIAGVAPAALAALNAEFRLLDAAGATVASAPIAANGSFRLPAVPPGTYRSSVVGEVPLAVSTGIVEVAPRGSVNVDIARVDPCLNLAALAGSPTTISASPSRPNFEPFVVDLGGGQRITAQRPLDVNFGTYINGVALNVRFRATPQIKPGQVLRGVKYTIFRPGATSFELGTATQAPYERSFNVGLLAPGRWTIKAEPVIDGEPCPNLGFRSIDVIADPMRATAIQPGTGRTSWNGQRYSFEGVIPHVRIGNQTVLPAEFNLPVPYFNQLSNRLSAGLQVRGSLALDGTTHMQALRLSAEARVLNQTLLPQGSGLNLMPALDERVYIPDGNLRQLAVPFGPFPVVPSFYREVVAPKVPVVSFFGVINVGVYARAGVGGSIMLAGKIYPLAPALEATLTASAQASLALGVYVDLLAGVAEAGADARIAAGVSLPLGLYAGSNPWIGFEDPCVAVRLTVRAYVSFLWGLSSRDTTKVLINEPRTPCPGLVLESLAAEELPDPPRVIAAPAVASADDGRMLSAYVEDSTPGAAEPSPRIAVRLSDPATGAWGAPLLISNAAHTVQSPAVAFVGPEATPMVVWVETMLTRAQAGALGDDLSAHLARQEIMYATYAGGAWGAPVRLTDDLAADGRPALVGDPQGATLAWVRDGDGDIGTRGDARIAVTSWDSAGRRWAPRTLLSGAGADVPSGTAVVPLSRGQVTLDGLCATAEYAGGASFSYRDAGEATGEVRLQHDGEHLYVCARGVAGSFADRSYNLYLDTTNGRRGAPQPTDLTLGVRVRDGATSSARGNGTTFVADTTIAGWMAGAGAAGADSVEYRVSLGLLGASQCGHRFGLELTHTWVNRVGDDYPAFGGFYLNPGSWGRFALECPSYNAQVSVARDADGAPLLAWTMDRDGDLTTGADRRIVLAERSGAGWVMLNPQPLPPRVDSPSVAFQRGVRRLSFLVRPAPAEGGPESLVGGHGELWTAHDSGAGWSAAPLRDAAGGPVFAERPRLGVNPVNGEGLLLFRRFGEGGTTAALGQISVSQLPELPGAAPTAPLDLTRDARQNALPSLAFNPANGNALIVKVARATPGAAALAVASDGAGLALHGATLSAGDSPVETLTLIPDADPALDSLSASQLGALPGSSVTITATVRNVGRGRAVGMEVRLFRGRPGSGTLIGSAEVPDGLDMNQALPVTFGVTMPQGPFPVYATLVTFGANGSTANDQASLLLSALEAPTAVSAAPSSAYTGALDVGWELSAAPHVDGYRVLRAPSPGGPFAFVGEARGATYTDMLLRPGHTYCYAVQAYNAGGTLSGLSRAACAMASAETVYLPLVRR
ncbi:MAG TPA: fibronectin type III domain-containing protein [Chloroflexaceae bacterium]|nr:fibronectin type III domain-containing protein [Chloroflexaceae bacterium]